MKLPENELFDSIRQMAEKAGFDDDAIIQRILLRYAAGLLAGYDRSKENSVPVPFHPELGAIEISEEAMAGLRAYEAHAQQWQQLGTEIFEAIDGKNNDFFTLIEKIRGTYSLETAGQVIEKAVYEYGSLQAWYEAEQKKLQTILENRQRVWALVSSLLARRGDPATEEKAKVLEDELEIKELEKLAAKAGFLISRTSMS